MDESERQVKLLVDLLTEVATATTPVTRITKKSRPGISEQASEAIKKVRKLERQWQKTESPRDHERLKRARGFKKRMLKECRRKAFHEFVDSCDNHTKLWKLGKMASNGWESSPRFAPEMKRLDGTLETEPSAKHKLFRDNFFPTPREAELDDIEDFEYPEPVPFPTLTLNETATVITSSHSDKAPEPEGLTFRILQLALPVWGRWITRIYNACIDLVHIPA